MIEKEIEKGDHLVLAGDIFDFFVGLQPKEHSQYRDFFELLKKKGSAGAKICYIEGNHDFHLDSTVQDLPGFHLAKAEVEIQTPKSRLYIAHGDLVDRGDYGYQALRIFFRSPLIRFTAFLLPEKAVEWIGRHSRRASQVPTGESRLDRIRRVFNNFARQKFNAGFDAIVLGHCHDDHSYDFHDGERHGRYMNVGYPKVHLKYLVFTDMGGLVSKPFIIPLLDR